MDAIEPREGPPSPSIGSLVPLILSLWIALSCASDHSTIPPYRDDPVEAARIEKRATLLCSDRGLENPPHRFTTDGCSAFPDGDWQACCVEHDLVYWCGGSSRDRKEADARLASCVADTGHELLAPFMKAGVRMGGAPWWPLPWRWGYGWDFPHGYDPDRAGDARPDSEEKESENLSPDREHEGSPD